jgi:hypothetical protein
MSCPKFGVLCFSFVGISGKQLMWFSFDIRIILLTIVKRPIDTHFEMCTASVVLWSEFLATDSEARVRFPALPDFLRNSGSGTGSAQPREYN